MREYMATEFATEAPNAPITSQRKVRSDLENSLPKPYLARALVAPDTDQPHGTPNHEDHGFSVLQQHASFFDLNGDGTVYPWETYAGFRKLGFNSAASLANAMLIHISLSFNSLDGRPPSPLLPVYIDNLHMTKHGSDSGVFDSEGRYVPANLENIFSKYAQTVPNKLSFKEVWNMTEGIRVAYDPFGWLSAKVEWILLYTLAKDEEGYLSKEAARGCFDGSLFEAYAKKKGLEAKKH